MRELVRAMLEGANMARAGGGELTNITQIGLSPNYWVSIERDNPKLDQSFFLFEQTFHFLSNRNCFEQQSIVCTGMGLIVTII